MLEREARRPIRVADSAVPVVVIIDIETRLRSLLRRWTMGFVAAALSSTVVGIVGLGMNILFSIGVLKNEGPWAWTAMVLIVLVFPLLFSTAHCLDKIDELDRSIRIERLHKRIGSPYSR